MFPNVNKIVEREPVIAGIQQLDDFLSTIRMDLRPWLNILCLGSKDVSAEGRN
jgi:hypothetical protein